MFSDKLAWDYWSDNLAIGIEAIDDDHRRILETIAALRGAVEMSDPQPTIQRTLELLRDYVDIHFRREEAMLAAAGYEMLAVHRALHDTFRAYAAECLAQDEPHNPMLLLSYLVNWWTGHIATDDKFYRETVLSRPEALSAAAALPPLPRASDDGWPA